MSVDFESDGFVIHAFQAFQFSVFTEATFNGFRVQDINSTIAPFTAFGLLSNTGLSGTPILTFDSNNLYMNFQGFDAIAGGDVVFAVAAVPEPKTYALMLAGLGLLGFVARRKKKTALEKAVAA